MQSLGQDLGDSCSQESISHRLMLIEGLPYEVHRMFGAASRNEVTWTLISTDVKVRYLGLFFYEEKGKFEKGGMGELHCPLDRGKSKPSYRCAQPHLFLFLSLAVTGSLPRDYWNLPAGLISSGPQTGSELHSVCSFAPWERDNVPNPHLRLRNQLVSSS